MPTPPAGGRGSSGVVATTRFEPPAAPGTARGLPRTSDQSRTPPRLTAAHDARGKAQGHGPAKGGAARGAQPAQRAVGWLVGQGGRRCRVGGAAFIRGHALGHRQRDLCGPVARGHKSQHMQQPSLLLVHDIHSGKRGMGDADGGGADGAQQAETARYGKQAALSGALGSGRSRGGRGAPRRTHPPGWQAQQAGCYTAGQADQLACRRPTRGTAPAGWLAAAAAQSRRSTAAAARRWWARAGHR